MSALRRLQNLLQQTSAVHRHAVVQHLTKASTYPSSNRLFSTRSGPVIRVEPRCGLADDVIDVRVSGLLPGQLVTIQAQVESECQRFKFQSSAMFQADLNGQVIVGEHASLGGTYEGVEPMGLIWSCKPTPDVAHLYPRLKKADSRQPFKYTIQLLDRRKPDSPILASEVIERQYLPDYVEREEISTGNAHGVLFLPNGKGASDPLPVVIEVRGLGNGVLEDRASLLASHGYAVFALDFMASFEPSKDVDIFYFKAQAFLDLFEYIRKHSRLDETRVGMFGFCTGSTLAIHGLSRLNLPIRCAVFSSMLEMLLSIIGIKMPDGKYLEPLGDLDCFTRTYQKDGYTWFCSKEPSEFQEMNDKLSTGETLLPVENISVPSLFLLSSDDQYQPSKERMLAVIDGMKKAGNGHLVEEFHLEGAGHLLDAPYMPICTKSSIKFPNIPHPYFTTWGGTTKHYAHSVEKSWRRVLDYFKQHLHPTELYR